VKSAHIHAHHANTLPTAAGIAEETWHELLEGNQRFVDGRMTQYRVRSQRESLISGQRPKAVIIGCSDSRVPPELVFDQSLGDLFVIRAAGNVVDAIALGSVEYAVEHLGTRMVVVLGHDRCGAVQAACSGKPVNSPNLKAIMTELQPSVLECSKQTGAALIRDVVEKNALHVAQSLIYRSTVLRRAHDADELQIIAARYDILNGEISRVQDGESSPARSAETISVHSA
jgi:carbonic anhydrase